MADWYRIRAEGTGPAVVYLYGRIGKDWFDDGNSALDFAKELDALAPRPLDLRVNSGGGDVFEGYAIYTALNRYPGTVTAYIDGVAASAASFLIMAADERVMGELSSLMIHKAWSWAIGNADEMMAVVEQLRAIDEQLVGVYSKHSTKSEDEIRDALAGEKWLTADEAVEWGLADRIDESLKAAACISRDMAKHYASIPEGIAVVDGPVAPPSDAADSICDTGDVEGQTPPAEAEPQTRTVAREYKPIGRFVERTKK